MSTEVRTVKEIQKEQERLDREAVIATPIKYLLSRKEWERELAKKTLKELNNTSEDNKPMKALKDLEVGDKVYMDSTKAFCTAGDDPYKITKVATKYDRDTGEAFKVLYVGSDWYDTRDGYDYNNPDSVYYIMSGEVLKIQL